jgi:hypothetical protein
MSEDIFVESMPSPYDYVTLALDAEMQASRLGIKKRSSALKQ